MAIAGVGYRSTVPYYSHVNSRTGKTAETQNVQSENQSTGGITLHWSDDAIFASGTPDGQSFSIHKADDYSADNPILNIKGTDKDGNSYEQQINPLTVDPENASFVEMMAVNAYLVDIGELDANDVSAYERPTEDDLEKADYLSAIRKSRDTQYSVGNMVGYHHGANVCNALVNLQQEQNGTVKYIDGINGHTRVTRIEGRLQSGIIGMSSFGEGDNFRFLEARYADDSTTENPIIEVRISEEFGTPTVFKVNINDIDPKNATQLEMYALCAHADAQGISSADRSGVSYMSLIEYAGVGGYEADNMDDFVGKKQNWTQIVSDAQSAALNGTENISDNWTQTLQDLFDAFIENKSNEQELGLFSYVKGMPSREQTLTDEKYTDEETGISWYVGQDGIPYMLEEDAEKLIRLSEDEGEDWLRKAAEMTGLISVNHTDKSASETEQADSVSVSEQSLKSLGSNAPEEVKQAWMKAAEQTGNNGLGMQENGMMSHITQLDVQRAVKWYNGESTDVLGTTVESARTAVEQALYDLEHPLEPLSNRSSSVQKSIEKEKEFYKAFLGNLS